MSVWWSVALTAIGLAGFWLAGRKVWWCWYLNIANQALWATYALITQQWGFLAGVAFYTAVFSQNAVRWTREHRQERERAAHAEAEPPSTGTAKS